MLKVHAAVEMQLAAYTCSTSPTYLKLRKLDILLCAVHSTPPRLLSARSVPCRQAYRPVGIDCKGTMP